MVKARWVGRLHARQAEAAYERLKQEQSMCDHGSDVTPHLTREDKKLDTSQSLFAL